MEEEKYNQVVSKFPVKKTITDDVWWLSLAFRSRKVCDDIDLQYLTLRKEKDAHSWPVESSVLRNGDKIQFRNMAALTRIERVGKS